jgi:hypothetical protein
VPVESQSSTTSDAASGGRVSRSQRDHVVDRSGARLRFPGLAHEPLRRDRAVDLEAAAEVVRRNQANVMEDRGHVEDLGIELEPVVPCQLDGPGIAPDRVVHKEGCRNVRDELAGSPRERGIRNGHAELGECLVHDQVRRLYAAASASCGLRTARIIRRLLFDRDEA